MADGEKYCIGCDFKDDDCAACLLTADEIIGRVSKAIKKKCGFVLALKFTDVEVDGICFSAARAFVEEFLK